MAFHCAFSSRQTEFIINLEFILIKISLQNPLLPSKLWPQKRIDESFSSNNCIIHCNNRKTNSNKLILQLNIIIWLINYNWLSLDTRTSTNSSTSNMHSRSNFPSQAKLLNQNMTQNNINSNYSQNTYAIK